MVDIPVPLPRDPKQRPRTGFSFARFCIPKLVNYSGRAIYMDADMLVLRDISDLWNISMEGHKVLIQRELKNDEARAPKKRIKQCAVMLLDCGRLDWKIEEVVAGLDAGKYTYEDLVYQLCLMAPDEIGYDIPFEWNSLERLEGNTCNIHYTDMPTQPWVSSLNVNDDIWLEEIRLMLADRTLSEAELQEEIQLGYFRPSLLVDLKLRSFIPKMILPTWRKLLKWTDRAMGYVAHRVLGETMRARSRPFSAMIADS